MPYFFGIFPAGDDATFDGVCYFEGFPFGREDIFSQDNVGAVLVALSPDERGKFLGLIAT